MSKSKEVASKYLQYQEMKKILSHSKFIYSYEFNAEGTSVEILLRTGTKSKKLTARHSGKINKYPVTPDVLNDFLKTITWCFCPDCRRSLIEYLFRETGSLDMYFDGRIVDTEFLGQVIPANMFAREYAEHVKKWDAEKKSTP